MFETKFYLFALFGKLSMRAVFRVSTNSWLAIGLDSYIKFTTNNSIVKINQI